MFQKGRRGEISADIQIRWCLKINKIILKDKIMSAVSIMKEIALLQVHWIFCHFHSSVKAIRWIILVIGFLSSKILIWFIFISSISFQKFCFPIFLKSVGNCSLEHLYDSSLKSLIISTVVLPQLMLSIDYLLIQV